MRTLCFTVLLLLATPVNAHELHHEVGRASGAVAVRLFSGTGNAFSFESYEVYRVGEQTPFQTGRTDALGRLVFIPDRDGRWRVKTFSTDGHGADFVLTVEEGGRVGIENGAVSSVAKILVGLCVIFGIFGAIRLSFRRA